MLIPLRDEISIQLGTNTLPRLFMASLLVTIVAQPVTSALVSSPRLPRPTALRRFFRLVSAVLLTFALLFWLIRGPVATLQPPSHRALSAADLRVGAAANSSPRAQLAADLVEDHQAARDPAATERLNTFSVRSGEATLSPPERVLFIAFYLFMGVVNLVATSLIWARCSEVFEPGSAKRAYGLLAGGATVGQLLGSLSALLCAHSTGQLSVGDIWGGVGVGRSGCWRRTGQVDFE